MGVDERLLMARRDLKLKWKVGAAEVGRGDGKFLGDELVEFFLELRHPFDSVLTVGLALRSRSE